MVKLIPKPVKFNKMNFKKKRKFCDLCGKYHIFNNELGFVSDSIYAKSINHYCPVCHVYKKQTHQLIIFNGFFLYKGFSLDFNGGFYGSVAVCPCCGLKRYKSLLAWSGWLSDIKKVRKLNNQYAKTRNSFR
jgi:rubredoxin